MTTNDPLILLIEDEAHVRRFLRTSLRTAGYRLIETATAAEGLRQAEKLRPDVVLLDLGLPDGDGVEVARKLRVWSSAQIIVLSARNREVDKVQALDAGADDFLGKPFGVAELLARVRVALRHGARSTLAGESVLTFGDIRLDLKRREVHRGDSLVHLTPFEYKLLVALAREAGTVLTYRRLLDDVWGRGVYQTHYLRVYIAQLRRKLEADPTRPRWFITETGVGYRMRDE